MHIHKNLKLGVVNAIVHMIYQQVICLGIFKGEPWEILLTYVMNVCICAV